MHDYVIAGAGSAGCVLAGRLSADPNASVCLLEAGPADTNPLIRMPIGLMWLMMSRRLNWRYFTEPQTHLDHRRLFWPRGKTLGGSSSSNAMIYVRGHPSDYDAWAALGNHGWSHAEVLPYFLRAEHHESLGGSPWHGAQGPLNVTRQRCPNVLSRVFIEAAHEAGYPLNDDFNGARQEGVGLFDVTQKNGERWSAARAYLQPARERANLTVHTGARAVRLLLEGGRAVGIRYAQGGELKTVRARREVIVCCGAIGTPQLLMLSGIGPEDELRRHGIAVAHTLPGVGANLQDHLDVLVVHRCLQPVSLGVSPRTLAAQFRNLADYLGYRSGPWTTNAAEAGGFVRSAPDLDLPDLQFHFTPARLHDHARNLRAAARTLFGHGYALHACVLRPKSRGRIGLNGADWRLAPRIDPDYLSAPEDMSGMKAALRAARRVLAAPAFDPYRGEEIRPGVAVRDDAAIERFIARGAESIYHPVGTCRMGNDDMAVVDDALRVRGIDGLRIVDASVMPTLVGGNTNAPTIMIAEKAADLIHAAAGAPLAGSGMEIA
ncbi:GMC family oxidoreductase [Noviherbaspirillum pedocola]|uniref:Choline dehydrogenase n=1 Tax=Noviherbaspirillum pedocola TaxID=2801341 RepID=A0A934T3C0_9BURK|nr:choline dehydrogenase [Noviherbaspirillum pedocola]MBK4737633.1 choline dehydrogenase [Noviherbaspirillum pedocola]